MINKGIIARILGILLIIEAGFMLTAIPVSLFYDDGDLFSISVSAGITLVAGLLAALLFKSSKSTIGKREGYLIVSLSWVVFSFFGSLPFYIGGHIPSYTDAFFETMSGFTTTGASILTDIEAQPHGLLYWRSMTQWLGGMGIIVFSLAILPILKIGSIQLFVAEVPGPAPDKLHPKVKDTAKRLWVIYAIFTFSEVILLLLGGMDLFDSVCHSFTTMATGGFSTRNASIAAFGSPYIHWVITIFMLIAGTNFTLAYFGFHGNFKKIIRNEEFLFYIALVALFTLVVGSVLHFSTSENFGPAFRNASFQVVSIVTTTGYATVDFGRWSHFLMLIMFIAMFTGGSAGSTGGGIKMVRLLLLVKNSRMELRRLIHPNAVVPIRLNHKAIPQQVIYNVLAFVVFYFFITGISGIIIAALGFDLETSFSAVAATLGNIGPGLGEVGPVFNYAHFPDFGKWFFSFLMLVGRLELFTVLILFSRSFYRK